MSRLEKDNKFIYSSIDRLITRFPGETVPRVGQIRFVDTNVVMAEIRRNLSLPHGTVTQVSHDEVQLPQLLILSIAFSLPGRH